MMDVILNIQFILNRNHVTVYTDISMNMNINTHEMLDAKLSVKKKSASTKTHCTSIPLTGEKNVPTKVA